MPEDKFLLNLDYFSAVIFAIDNIDQIDNLDKILSQFKNSVQDITKERHTDIELLAISNQYLGQKTYYFKYQESSSLVGELNLDFLPRDYKVNLHEQLKNLAMHEGMNLKSDMRLVNFRIQLFSLNSWSLFKLKRKYKQIKKYLDQKYGNPNKLDTVISGVKIDCWLTKKTGVTYAISFYYQEKNTKMDTLPFISFSISEAFINN